MLLLIFVSVFISNVVCFHSKVHEILTFAFHHILCIIQLARTQHVSSLMYFFMHVSFERRNFLNGCSLIKPIALHQKGIRQDLHHSIYLFLNEITCIVLYHKLLKNKLPYD